MAKKVATFLKLLFLVVNFGLVLLGIAVIRALTLHNPDESDVCTSDDKDYISDTLGLSNRLSEAIKFKTINFGDHNYNRDEILNFTAFIVKSFPHVHSSSIVSREVVNSLSLLYYIQGKNKTLKPYLLAGHLDVVPVEESHWAEPPFSGCIKDGYVWGRGTIDCKHVVMGSLEALEFLLKNNFQPQRSFYLAFGHDEESSGKDGAKQISNVLKSRKVELEYILDEGSFVIDNLVPGVKSPVAIIGISEKGSLNLELSVITPPGHSSFPGKETAIVILAKAISKLEGNVFPSMFGKGPERIMLEELAYCASFPMKVVYGNTWLFKPLITLYMTSPIMNAIQRTTTAVTMVSGGTKLNILPSSASAGVNLRVHPAQTIQEAVDFVKNIINDERVTIKILSQTAPHPVSPIDTFGYSQIKKSVRQIYSDSCVVPFALIANTDTRWYLNLTNSIYRFSLARMTQKETSRFHGLNEKILVNNYVEIVNFFMHLIKNSDNSYVPSMHVHDDL